MIARLFWVVRRTDGTSATIADGVEWPDTSVSTRWRGRDRTAQWSSIEELQAALDGQADIRWIDLVLQAGMV